MAQQFYLSSLWWITLDERSVKGRIHLNTCQPILNLIPSLLLVHSQLLIRIDQFHGDLPVECGWLLLSSRKMNCISLQRQLSTLAHSQLSILIPFLCLWRQVDGPSSYPTVKTHATVICTSPPYQSCAHRMLQDVLSPRGAN